MSAVANSSPLIHLAAIGDLHLLKTLFREITIPQAVYREVVAEGRGRAGVKDVRQAAGAWIRVAPVADQDRVVALIKAGRLHTGESEAIVLAEETQMGVLLLDDRRAVTYARRRGLTVLRTPALYGMAKSLGLVPSVREKLEALRHEGFYLKESDLEQILRAVGEV